jgi:hypothetical protein
MRALGPAKEKERSAMDQSKGTSVERMVIASDRDRREALATVKIGNVRISGVAVWRGGNGRLSVYWPRYWDGAGQSEAIELAPELRAEIESDVISAYRDIKTQAKKVAKNAQGGNREAH